MPKEHKQVINTSNFDLWNDLTTINTNFPNDEIQIDHIVKDFGHSYGIDMKISCNNAIVQKQLDAAYERNMRIPRFTKHADFENMIIEN